MVCLEAVLSKVKSDGGRSCLPGSIFIDSWDYRKARVRYLQTLTPSPPPWPAGPMDSTVESISTTRTGSGLWR